MPSTAEAPRYRRTKVSLKKTTAKASASLSFVQGDIFKLDSNGYVDHVLAAGNNSTAGTKIFGYATRSKPSDVTFAAGDPMFVEPLDEDAIIALPWINDDAGATWNQNKVGTVCALRRMTTTGYYGANSNATTDSLAALQIVGVVPGTESDTYPTVLCKVRTSFLNIPR